jgi:hypothetical protein
VLNVREEKAVGPFPSEDHPAVRYGQAVVRGRDSLIGGQGSVVREVDALGVDLGLTSAQNWFEGIAEIGRHILIDAKRLHGAARGVVSERHPGKPDLVERAKVDLRG